MKDALDSLDFENGAIAIGRAAGLVKGALELLQLADRDIATLPEGFTPFIEKYGREFLTMRNGVVRLAVHLPGLTRNDLVDLFVLRAERLRLAAQVPQSVPSASASSGKESGGARRENRDGKAGAK